MFERTIQSNSSAALCILLTVVSFCSGWPPSAASRAGPRKATIVSLPNEPLIQIPSPDGKWNLIFECPNDCRERKLWIEEAASHTRRAIKEYERSLSISWAPDSQFFFVNDASGSTDTRCYVYEAATLREINVEKLVLAADVAASKFLNAGHSYLKANRWGSSRELLVTLEGHNDGEPPRGFTLRYRVSLGGNIVKLSQHVER